MKYLRASITFLKDKVSQLHNNARANCYHDKNQNLFGDNIKCLRHLSIMSTLLPMYEKFSRLQQGWRYALE